MAPSSLSYNADANDDKTSPNKPQDRDASTSQSSSKRKLTTTHLLVLSFLIQVGLLLYANHIDNHPERYGGLKYTDVDWRVVSDGAKLIFNPDEEDGNIARGWLMRYLGLKIGDPYERATFRYTPLLPLLISPSLFHPLLGRLLLVLISLYISPLLLSLPTSDLTFTPTSAQTFSAVYAPGSRSLSTSASPSSSLPQPFAHPARSQCSFWSVHLLWTLNPFVLNITTRGSPESIICLLVIVLLVALRKGREIQAAIWLGLAVSWKIYPAIYVPAIWSFLARPGSRRESKPTTAQQYSGGDRDHGGWLGWRVWRFGTVAGVTFGVVNGILWAIWGQPFLEHTYLYHLTRQDHRHNFSPYFYPIYLSFYNSANHNTSIIPALNTPSTSTPTPTPMTGSVVSDLISRIVRNPLTSFLPQLSLVLLSGFGLESATRSATTESTEIGKGSSNLETAMFVQTAAFVVFNKVCTSQYFMWFLPLLPPILSSLTSLSLSRRKIAILVGSWVIAQAVWLATAYQLELMGRSVYLAVWAGGLSLFGVSIWVLGELIDAFGAAVVEQRSARVANGVNGVREKVE
ncbi:phosphatidylinositol glycan, class M [Kwoniella heveanensis CBS 569]|nr:phosphatidylinositol glycan, class M [Kwoniella heveanensis CBS 569]